MKCKELGAKYNVSAMQVGRLRKQFFPESEGGELTDEEFDVLTNYFEDLDDLETRKDMEEAVKPRFVEGFVTYAKPKHRFVECKIRDNGEIVTVRALLPNGHDATQQLFRSIKLEVINYNDKNYYRHASLANVAWPENMLA